MEKTLPTKEKFYNYLKDEDVADSAYEHVLVMWELLGRKFGCDRNLGSLATLYLTLDTLLLGKRESGSREGETLSKKAFSHLTLALFSADVFQEFRRLAMSSYQLEALRYLTLPSLALQAALKWTGVELELITEPNLYLFFEEYSRGGLVFVANRFATSNLPGMPNFQATLPLRLILYLDKNNLYGHR